MRLLPSLPFGVLLLPSLAQAQLPPPPAPPENPITAEKVLLGKILFWEEQLSSDNSMACGTCHMPAAGGQDPRALGQTTLMGTILEGAPRHPGPDGIFDTEDDAFGSPGMVRADGNDDYSEDPLFGFHVQATGRSSPDFMGAAWFDSLFWDGRATGKFVNPETGQVSIASGGALESQAVGPILSDVEMSNEERTWSQVTSKLAAAEPLALATDLPPDIVSTLAQYPSYPELFAYAFGTPEITAERIGFAIATYERVLVPDQTPYDLWAAGDNSALTPQQLQGLTLFRGGRFACAICHTEPFFHNNSFHNLGLADPANNPGLQEVTGDVADRGKFKTPGLRNVGLRTQMFHNGSARTLQDMLDVYLAGGGPFLDNRDILLSPINANPGEVPAVIAFLEEGLTDPRAANELPPFDRPRLASEEPSRSVQLIGDGVPGASGEVPVMIASAPPASADPGFRLGVGGARGGAYAFLVLGPPSSGLGDGGALVVPQLRRTRGTLLPGAGLTDGFTTFHFPTPVMALLAGGTWRAQWWVRDPGAPGMWARSRTAEFTPF